MSITCSICGHLNFFCRCVDPSPKKEKDSPPSPISDATINEVLKHCLDVINSQDDLIKELTDELKKISGCVKSECLPGAAKLNYLSDLVNKESFRSLVTKGERHEYVQDRSDRQEIKGVHGSTSEKHKEEGQEAHSCGCSGECSERSCTCKG